MPAITTTLVFAIVPAIAKALLSQLLKDKPVLSDLAPDLLDWLMNKAKAERNDAAQQISAIGENVAAKLRPIIAEAQLPDNELAAVLHEFIATLDEADVDAARLVEARLSPARLARGMLRARPKATTLLSADATALYERLVREASPHLTAIASEFAGYASLRDATLLQDIQRIWDAVLTLLRRPDEESDVFESEYRAAINDKLNKLERFGMDDLDTAYRKQKLNVAYVTVQVDRVTRMIGEQPEEMALLRQLSDDSIHASNAQSAEERQASPIDNELASQRRIVIRGDAGSGKTTLLQWIAINAATKQFSGVLSLWNNVVPFFIRLRQVSDQGFPAPENYAELVAETVAGMQPRGWAHAQLRNGRAVVLIDGVDELSEGKRKVFFEKLQDLVRQYPHARYIITSRPSAINKNEWPEWNEWTQEEGFAEVVIQPMSNAAVEEFIEHWHTSYAEGVRDPGTKADILAASGILKQSLPERPALRRLASIPLLCAMICALHYKKRHHLPTERIELYQECINMLLEQRDKARDISLVDYPDLTLDQKRRLLQQLAYRMMRGGESELPIELVDRQLEEGLPRLGVDLNVENVRKYFVQRSGLLREPVEGRIDFAHRTFQEYLTAQAIARLGEVSFLKGKLNDDQWQETIVLAARMLQIKQGEDVLSAMLKKAGQSRATTSKAQAAVRERRRRLLALALACLGTGLDIDPALRHEILETAQELFPPYAREQQRAVAAAGEHAIPYLLRERQPNIAAMAVCIRTLALIGGEKALTAIESYKDVDNDVVREAIDVAWPSFDHREYARRLLQDRRAIHMSDVALLPTLAELPQLQSLSFREGPFRTDTRLKNLGFLANVPQLQRLSLLNTQVSDFSDLANVPQLQQLSLLNTRVSDLSFLAHVPQLQTLNLNGTGVSAWHTYRSCRRLTSGARS